MQLQALGAGAEANWILLTINDNYINYYLTKDLLLGLAFTVLELWEIKLDSEPVVVGPRTHTSSIPRHREIWDSLRVTLRRLFQEGNV